MENQKETTEGRGSSGINFPSYYPHMCKTHTAAQSQGVECAWGLGFFVAAFFFFKQMICGLLMKIRSLQATKIKMELICF